MRGEKEKSFCFPAHTAMFGLHHRLEFLDKGVSKCCFVQNDRKIVVDPQGII